MAALRAGKHQAFIFDLGGTLVLPWERMHDAITCVFMDRAQKKPSAEALNDLGQDWTKVWNALADECPKLGSRDHFFNAVHDVFASHTARLRPVQQRPGMSDVLAFGTRNGFRMAVATNSPLNVAHYTLSMIPAGRALSTDKTGKAVVVTIDDLRRENLKPKPAPDSYRLVTERLGVAPEKCIAFEDTERGLESARNAGIGVAIDVRDYKTPRALKDHVEKLVKPPVARPSPLLIRQI